MGQIWSERGNHQCALSYFERALNTIEPDNIYRATINRHLGNSYRSKGDYNAALEYLDYINRINGAILICFIQT